MLWPHTKTIDVSKDRKFKITNRKSFIFAQDKFYDLLIPPSFKNMTLTANRNAVNSITRHRPYYYLL